VTNARNTINDCCDHINISTLQNLKLYMATQKSNYRHNYVVNMSATQQQLFQTFKTSHHIEQTEAGLKGLCIQEIFV